MNGYHVYERTKEARIEDLPGALPVATISSAENHASIAEGCIKSLECFESSNLTADAIWRDLFALTGSLRTFAGVQDINRVWTAVASDHRPSHFELIPGTSRIVNVGGIHAWIAARFDFRTSGVPASSCSGQIGIVPDGDTWKIWMMTTILEEIRGHPNPDFMTASAASESVARSSAAVDYDVVVVGAGFAGLCLAGRLKAMGINHLLVEKNEQIGDNWTNRYDSARFHTSKYYSDMPLGQIFRDGYDYLPSAQDLVRGYQDYARKHKLTLALSTVLESANFDDQSKLWELVLKTRNQPRTLRTFNLVFAIGGGGSVPIWPNIKNREVYNGVVLHSVDYKNTKAWKGKRGVVIGSGNTAHDVSEDMLEAGMTVTMCQRGRTTVIPIGNYRKWSDVVYNPTLPLEEGDRQTMAIPLAITRHISLLSQKAHAAKEPERYDSLERQGFRCERNADLWKLLSERLGGHYIDVGTSKKISNGLIKVKSDSKIQSFTERGLKFENGSEIEADVIVACTGFDLDVLGEVVRMVGPDIGAKLDHYWGIDAEGELRGAYRPLSYPGIFYTGGGVTYARFYSRFIALQIGATLAGHPLKRYE